jgi:3-oxoacyl-[acyl-carrier protein] reductase
MIPKKNIIITGASGYLGKEISKSFNHDEYNLILQYNRNFQNLNIFNSAFKIQSDLGNGKSRKKFIEKIRKLNLKIDVLILNAGSALMYKNFWESDISLYESSIALNFIAPMEIIKEIFDLLNPNSSIIYISSNSVKYNGGVNGLHYTAAKAASESLMLGLSKVTATKQIRINIIRVGLMNGGQSHNLDGYSKHALNKRKKLIPMGKFVEPYEVAKMCSQISSDEMKSISGSIITISGGE